MHSWLAEALSYEFVYLCWLLRHWRFPRVSNARIGCFYYDADSIWIPRIHDRYTPRSMIVRHGIIHSHSVSHSVCLSICIYVCGFLNFASLLKTDFILPRLEGRRFTGILEEFRSTFRQSCNWKEGRQEGLLLLPSVIPSNHGYVSVTPLLRGTRRTSTTRGAQHFYEAWHIGYGVIAQRPTDALTNRPPLSVYLYVVSRLRFNWVAIWE